MDKKMTLEHVASDFRAYAADGGASLSRGDLLLIADAIDAEIKTRGKAVAIVGSDDVIWLKPEACEVDVLLYTAPPAPKIEVTPDFVHSVLEHYPLDESGNFRTLSPVRLAVALEAALKETP